MIVILNTINSELSREIGHGLSLRLNKCGFINLDESITEEPAANHNQKTREAIYFITKLQKNGQEHFVINETFISVNSLKHMRMSLDPFDNEIYAYRLQYNEHILKKDTSKTAYFQDHFWQRYTQWFMKQEQESLSGDMGYVIDVDSIDPAVTSLLLWNDIHEPVSLEAYNDNWNFLFLKERELLQEVIGQHIDSIEHVGSTAIPGMYAKPVIDILIMINNLSEATRCIGPLAKLGYAFIDYPQNRDRMFFRKGKPRTHHVHIVETGSVSALDHLHFRDALLTYPEFQQEYVRLKKESMKHFKRRRALYGDRKTAFVRRVLSYYRTE